MEERRNIRSSRTIMRSLHDVHEMNAYMADCIWLSTFLNFIDFYETWYGQYAIGGEPKFVLFISLQSAMPT
jgi:hypothetical protein